MSGSPPGPLAPDDDWARWHQARRSVAPPWGFDRDYVTSHALERLPALCGAMGTGDAVAMTKRPSWWAGMAISDANRALHGLISPGAFVALRLTPASYDLLLIDRATGEWECPNMVRRGSDLVSLAAWRWAISETKAAWRMAKLCGLRRPTP